MASFLLIPLCCIREPLMHTSIQSSSHWRAGATTRPELVVDNLKCHRFSPPVCAWCELWKWLALSPWVSGRWFVSEIITMWIFLFCRHVRDILQCQLTLSTVTFVTDGDVFRRRLVIDDTFSLLWSPHRDHPSQLPWNPVQGVKLQCSQCYCASQEWHLVFLHPASQVSNFERCPHFICPFFTCRLSETVGHGSGHNQGNGFDF